MARRGPYGAGRGDRRTVVRRDSWFERNPVTVVSVTLAALFLVGTPQVRLILFDLPQFATLGLSRSGVAAAALWVYFFLLFGAYFAIAWSMLDARPLEAEAADPVRPGVLGWPQRWVRRLQRIVEPFLPFLLVSPAQRMNRGSRRALGVLLLLFGAVPLLPFTRGLVQLAPIALDRVWPQVFGVALVLMGLWLGLARLPGDPGRPRLPREQALWDHRVALSLLAGRCVELLLTGTVVGELIWWTVDSLVQNASWRIFTLWGSCQMALFIVLFGRLADAAGRKAWTRLLIGGAALTLLMMMSSSIARIGLEVHAQTGSPRARVFSAVDHEHNQASDRVRVDALTAEWFDRVDARLDSMGDPNHPVVFVAASGGGSRAAIWATWVLEALERTLLPGEAPEGATLADRVLFISSVSGGSLGAVHWALGEDEYYPGLERPEKSLRLVNTPVPELEDGYRELRARTCGDGTGLPAWALRCEPGSASLFDPLIWPAASARADEMSTDFNAPTLRGMVLPWVARGQSLERFWRSHFRWTVPPLQTPAGGRPRYDAHGELVARSGPPAAPDGNAASVVAPPAPPPLLLVNATEVHTGFRLVAGLPALPPGLLWDQGSPEHMPRAPDESEAAYRGRVYWSNLDDPDGPKARSVSDIDPYLAVHPAEAVRMSANFPWGFDLPALRVPMDHKDRWGVEQDVLVVDGGVLDNTGIDAVNALIVRLDHLAHSPEAPPRLADRSRRLLARLARRGVVLLEIDSGSKPQAPGLADRALRDLLMPVSALSEAAYVRERASRVEYMSTLQRVLGENAEELVRDRLVEATTGELFRVQEASGAKSAAAQRRRADYLSQRLGLTYASFEGLDFGALKGFGLGMVAGIMDQQTEKKVMEEETQRAREVVGARVAHVTYTANRGENIMTAWALTPAQKGELLFRFVFEHAIEREELLEDWQTLRGENQLLERVIAGSQDEDSDAMLSLIGQLSEDQESVADDEYRDAVGLQDERARLWLREEGTVFTQREPPTPQAGWMFLGSGQGQGSDFEWETLYVEMPAGLTLKPDEMEFRDFRLGRRVRLRAGLPNVAGLLPDRVGTAAKGALVKLGGVRQWLSSDGEPSGLYFAHIPPLPQEK